MRIFNSDRRRGILKSTIAILFLALVVTQCFTIVSVDQPESADAGSVITVTVQASIDPTADWPGSRLVAAILVPKSWNAASNTTVTYEGSIGSGTMSLIPSTVNAPNVAVTWSQDMHDRIGIGQNLIDEVEWVVFWSDESYDIKDADPPITGNVTIQTKVGPQNTISQIGYFIGESQLDLSSHLDYDVKFTDCFKVTNGSGATIDFCNPQISSILPVKALDNDVVTISFDATVIENELVGSDKVYICATGYSGADAYSVCTPGETTLMTSTGTDHWRIDMWPRKFFNVPEGQTLDRIEYTFTDETGSVVVQDPSTGSPLVFEFSCQ